MESLAESRASFLYRSVGFTAKNPPNIVRFARALLGEGALRFVGAPGERGALVTSISRAGCRIYLQHGVSDEENVFAIARVEGSDDFAILVRDYLRQIAAEERG